MRSVAGEVTSMAGDEKGVGEMGGGGGGGKGDGGGGREGVGGEYSGIHNIESLHLAVSWAF